MAIGLAMVFLPIGRSVAGPGDGQTELPINRGLMQRLGNFTLKDVTTGRDRSLYALRGSRAIVLVFIGTDCPVGNQYAPRLIEMNRDYKTKGVVFLGISSNAHDSEKEVARYVHDMGFDFPVLKDLQNKVADSGLVERTPEVLVLDGAGRVRFRGAIDDQYKVGKARNAPTQNYVRDALDALLANQPLKVTATKVEGCLLDRVEPPAVSVSNAPRVRPAAAVISEAWAAREREHPIAVGEVTYAGKVAAIVQNKCQGCHRPGQSAPFALLSYDQVRKHAATIREVIDERRMPPWHADPGYGHFANDRSLSADERAAFLAWLDRGTPLGDPKDLPPARPFTEGWTIGKPDVVFEMPEPYYVAAQGVVAYIYFRVPTHFTEDKWIQAAEAIPGDRSVVHHIVVYVLPETPKGERPRPIHICGYAPGDLPMVYPEGTAKRLPAGATILLQLHYTPNGKVRTDRSKVGFVFAKSKVTREAFTLGIANPDLMLPARADNVAVASSYVVPSDARLLNLMPHMHLRGKDFQYKATRPGESPHILLSVPAYDFGWQSYYNLATPMDLPKGTRIDCLAHFDNSEKNPYNPNPRQLVRWGEQTFEEMMIGYVDLDVPVGTPPFPPPELAPTTERTAFRAIQAIRRLVGSGAGGTEPGKGQRRQGPG
ncbi:MAG TPA: redoxin domain-containing protein [Isosphaeraceae bacterium]|nr:redoxin domain-containing protein [Isosphaeraceae bacterium]